jgi:DNA-binding transcriptional LysR family regulator
MGDLDLRRLRYFLILAKELNYGRAADALHIAQPALSRSIAALERELGVTLFERSRSGTRLAAAGELLRDDARALLQAAETLQRRVRLADREGRSVRIGFMPGLIVTPVVRRLQERWPGLRVDVVRTSWTEQIDALRDGRFDASFARRPFDVDGLTVVDLYAEPRVAVLPVDHPQAGSNEILLADLVGDLLLQPAGFVPEWRGATASPVSPEDDQASDGEDSAAHSPTVEEKLELVASGRGIVILPASTTRYYNRPDVTYARVIDLVDTEVCLVIETRRHSEVLAEMLKIARTVPPSEYSGLTDAGPASVGT